MWFFTDKQLVNAGFLKPSDYPNSLSLRIILLQLCSLDPRGETFRKSCGRPALVAGSLGIPTSPKKGGSVSSWVAAWWLIELKTSANFEARDCLAWILCPNKMENQTLRQVTMIGRLWLYKSPHSWWTWNTTQFNRLWDCFCCSQHFQSSPLITTFPSHVPMS